MNNMNKLWFLLIMVVVFAQGCQSNNTTDGSTLETTDTLQASLFGESFELAEKKGAGILSEILEGEVTEVEGVFEVEIAEVCQSKGCWMNVMMPDGSKMKITFKDYGFFVPKNSAGKTAVINGMAKMQLTSVEELRHYAEDAGKSEEEIASITQPEKQIHFVASGVAISEIP